LATVTSPPTKAPVRDFKQMEVTPGRPIKEPSTYLLVDGVATQGVYLKFSNDRQTIERVIAERVFSVKDKTTGIFRRPRAPQREIFQNLQSFRDIVLNQYQNMYAMPIRMTAEEFVKTSAQHKRKCYEQARLLLAGKEPEEQDAIVQMFVKAEKN